MGQSATLTSGTELHGPGEAGGPGRERLQRPYPWSNLVLRAADSLKLREPGLSGWEFSDTQVILLLERVDHHLRALVESPEQFLDLCPALHEAEDGAHGDAVA